jgi:GAF domain-containing protein
MKEDRLTAILAIHSMQPRQWHSEEIALVASVAARCWESMERARILRALEADREELRRQHAELKTIYDTAQPASPTSISTTTTIFV